MNTDMTEREIEILRNQFPAGTPIRLISMNGEPQMAPGLKGKVALVDDMGQIHVAWENDSSLALNVAFDEFIDLSGPTASDYLYDELGFTDDTQVWFRKKPKGHQVELISIACLIKAIEIYLEEIFLGVQKRNPEDRYSTNIESVFELFLQDRVLSEEEVCALRKKKEFSKDESEEGICPKCDSDELEYGISEIMDNSTVYVWECKACGATGREYGTIVFDGHIVDRLPKVKK